MGNKVLLEWSEEAYRELFAIFDYYETTNPEYGLRCIENIEKQVENLETHPFLGLESKKKDIRKLIIADTSHIVAYELIPNTGTPKTAYILSVMDGQNFKKTKNY